MFKILSLDGGGIRGIITAHWLDCLRKEIGKPLHEKFDLIVGTSTGSILAAAVALGKDNPPGSLVKFYQEHGSTIFKHSLVNKPFSYLRFPLDWLPTIFGPKYNSKNLEKVLKDVFKAETLKDCHTRLLIPTYCINTRNPMWLRSYAHKTNTETTPVWEACLSSSSAPVYFQAHIVEGAVTQCRIDGGIVANNPSACALAEAVKYLNVDSLQKAGPILLISLGTGNLAERTGKDEAQRRGILGWARPLLPLIFDGSSDSVDFICKQLLPDNMYHRMQVRLDSGNDAMDDASEANLVRLLELAAEYISRGEGQNQFDRIVRTLL
jgi:uncharacterized protein